MARQFKGIAADFIKAMKTQFIGRGADPNDIFVQDLFKYNPPANSGGVGRLTQLAKGNVLDEYAALTQEDRHILSTLLAVYNENIQTKRDILTQARNLFETSDIVQTVIDVMIDDGFNSFQNEKEEFKIEYTLDKEDLDNLGEEYQQQIQNIIDDFVDKFALKSKVAEIVPDLLRDGEYAFGVLFDEKGEKGVTEIVDDLDVINLIPFPAFDGGRVLFVGIEAITGKKVDAKVEGWFHTIGFFLLMILMGLLLKYTLEVPLIIKKIYLKIKKSISVKRCM